MADVLIEWLIYYVLFKLLKELLFLSESFVFNYQTSNYFTVYIVKF